MDKQHMRGFSEWEKAAPDFDLIEWRRRGGKPRQEPYFDRVPGIDGGRRIFVDALIFPTWAEWRRERDRALAAAIYADGCETIGFMFTGESAPISPKPLFLLERKYGSWHIWLNAVIENEQAFSNVYMDARIAADRQEKFDREHRNDGSLGSMLTLSFAQRPPFDGTQYDSCLNETGDVVTDLFLRMTAKGEGDDQ